MRLTMTKTVMTGRWARRWACLGKALFPLSFHAHLFPYSNVWSSAYCRGHEWCVPHCALSFFIPTTGISHLRAFARPDLLFPLPLKWCSDVMWPSSGSLSSSPQPCFSDRYSCLQDLTLLRSLSHPIFCRPLQPCNRFMETTDHVSHPAPTDIQCLAQC